MSGTIHVYTVISIVRITVVSVNIACYNLLGVCLFLWYFCQQRHCASQVVIGWLADMAASVSPQQAGSNAMANLAKMYQNNECAPVAH